MNKLDMMSQKTIDLLLAYCIEDKPGVTSEALWRAVKEWDHKCTVWEFETALGAARSKFRCTNKQWYPIGHKSEPKRSTGKAADPRRTRMDW